MAEIGRRNIADTKDLLKERTVDAWIQQNFLEPREADKKKIGEGWTFRYAVGADVVNLYADPFEHAASGGDQAVGCGEVFRGDDPANKVAIAAAIARYIFFVLQEEVPLILFPSVSGQLRRNIDAIAGKLGNPEHSDKKINDILESLRKRGENLDPADLSDLHRAFLAQGPAAELKRIRELVDSGRICRTEVGLPDSIGSPFRDALKQLNDRTSVQELHGLIKDWTNRLVVQGRRDRKTTEEAAEALARLEIANMRLMRMSKDKPYRILYITADNTVMHASAAYKPKYISDGGDFALSFIRNPRAFVDEPLVLGSVSQERPTFGSVLLLWLGHFKPLTEPFTFGSGRSVIVSREVEEKLAEVLERDGDSVDRAWQEWKKIASSVTRHVPPGRFLDQFRSLSDGDQFRAQLEIMRPQIENAYLEAFEDLIDVIVEFRMAMEFPGQDQPWEPPGLCFEKQSAITEFFRQAERWWREGSPFSRDNYLRHRAAIEQQDRENDGGAYFLNLAHAWLLAAQGHWRSAAVLAKRAESAALPAARASDGSLMPHAPNGREAKYLQAVCLRHSASTPADLKDISFLLAEVKDIAARERLNAIDPDYPPDIVIERIAVEGIALRLCNDLFAWMISGKDSGAISRFKAIIPDIEGLIDELEYNLRKSSLVESQRTSIPGDMPSLRHRESLRRQLIRRCRRSLLGLALMPSAFDWDLAKAVWSALSKDREEIKHPASSVGELLMSCGDVLFEAATVTRKTARISLLRTQKALRDWISGSDRGIDSPARSLIVFPYDPQRFLAWIDTVEAERDRRL